MNNTYVNNRVMKGKLSGLNFKQGYARILADLDFNTSLIDQQSLLVQNICQIEFRNGYLIDVGWYPVDMEVNKSAYFIVYLIKNCNWDNPVDKVEVDELNKLKETIISKIDIVNRI